LGERATAGFIVSLIGGIIDLIVAVILIGMASIVAGLKKQSDL
jgi:hypothetical protein